MGGERRLGGGPADAGDTSWLMFPKDGEVSHFGQHTTWTFPLFVQMTRRLQTCWHIHPPFRSSSITLMASLQEMNTLKQRDRIHRICLWLPDMNLQNLIEAIEEYPILEDLIIMHRTKSAIIFPDTFQAPHLHHLTLVVPIRSRLLPTAVVLVTFCLVTRHGPLIHLLLSNTLLQ